MTVVNEKLFEDAIADHLVNAGGYTICKTGVSPAHVKDFDPTRGLDTVELFTFLAATQPTAWANLVKAHGSNPDTVRTKFLQRLATQLDDRGTISVLRQGITDQNITIRLAFFKPAHGLTPELGARYDANRLTVTRQLPYDPASHKTLDLCLFLNGIPVATAELKNHLTGQTIEHAITQYREDRDPKNLTLSRRAVVQRVQHECNTFAVRGARGWPAWTPI